MHTSASRWPVQRPLIIFLLVVLTLSIALTLLLRSAWLRDRIGTVVTEKTGREFVARGRFWIKPAWPLRIHMEGVTYANPAWAESAQMLQLQEVDFSLEPVPLLHGQLVFDDVHAVKPMVDLEQQGNKRNWILNKGSSDGTAPVINRLTLDQGLLRFRDSAKNTDLKLNVTTLTRSDGKDEVSLRAAGTFQGAQAKAAGTGGSLLSIKDPNANYPVDLEFRVGATKASLKGTIKGLARFAGADLDMDLSGQSMADLYNILGLAIPPTPAYRVKGHLARKESVWQFHQFSGQVGESDLSGDLDVRYAQGRPDMRGTLTSKLLDLHDLGGFIGASATQRSVGQKQPANAQSADAGAQSDGGRVLPASPFHLDKLRAMDADIRFQGKAIRHDKLPIDDMDTHILLKDGVLNLKPINFGVAGGNIASNITLEAADPIRLDADLKFQRLDLAKLMPDKDIFKNGSGLIGGRAVIKGRGNSVAALAAHADGTVGIASSGGRVSKLLLDMLGLNAVQIIKELFAGDEEVELRCAVGDFEVKDGQMRPRVFLIDTEATTISISGSINLRDETLDLTAQPVPKQLKPLAKLHLPLHAKGTFKDPKFGLAAIIAAVLPPTAAVAPIIDLGPGEKSNCGALISQVQQHAKTRIPEAGSQK